VAIDALNKKFN